MALRSFSGFPQSHYGVEARKHGFRESPLCIRELSVARCFSNKGLPHLQPQIG